MAAKSLGGAMERHGSPEYGSTAIRNMRRFSLRTLLIVVTLLAGGLGYHAHRVDQQRQVVAVIHELGGLVGYGSPLPYTLAETLGFDRVGYVNWVRLRQPFVHLALDDLQSLPSLRALEVACKENQRPLIEGALFDEVIRDALPGVSVDYVNDKWVVLPVPKAISDVLPEKIDARSVFPPHFRRTDAVRLKDGTIRFVLWDEFFADGVPNPDYAIAVLMDRERVVDWKSVAVKTTRNGLIEGIIEDVDGDGQLDVAIRIAGAPHGPFSGLHPAAKRWPNDARTWMAAYSVHADGLVSIFSE
jgi:hypothetical protein